MKLEVVQTFPQIKGVSGNLLCCPDMDLVVVTSYDPFRDLKVFSLSTGKKIMVHRFPRYTQISRMYRAGRWLFIGLFGPEGSEIVAFDLQELVIRAWDDVPGVNWAKMIFRGCCGRHAFLQAPEPHFTWFAFRLADGVVVDRPPSAQKVEKGMSTNGRHFVTYDEHPGGVNYRTIRADPEGMPTDETLGDFVWSRIVEIADWDERILVAVNPWNEPDDQAASGTNGDEPDLRCLDLKGNVCYEVRLPLPALDHVTQPDLRPRAHAVLVTSAQGRRGVAFREWSMPDEKRGIKMALNQWVAFDRDSGKILWHRQHVSPGSRRSFVVGGHLLAHDPEGIHLTDVDSGETEDFAVANNVCYPGDGYGLECFRDCYFGDAEPPEPMPYFFWQEEGKPMVMARFVE
jgi:hypothetical protein